MMNVTRSGSCSRLRISFAARPTATRSRERRSSIASSSVIRSPEVAAPGSRPRGCARRRSCDGCAGRSGRSAAPAPSRAARRRARARGTCRGRRARAGRSGSGASRSSARGSRPDSRSARRPRTRAARARRGRAEPTRRARPRARRALPRAAPGRPRPRTPSAARSARARAGRDRDAGSDPRRPSAARRLRSGASPRPRPLSYASSGACSASASSTLISATDVADSGVTATVRTRSSGTRETSWIESTAPSDATQSRGSRPQRVGVARVLDRGDRRRVELAARRASGSARSGRPAPPPPRRRRGRRPAPCSRSAMRPRRSPACLDHGGSIAARASVAIRIGADLRDDAVTEHEDLMAAVDREMRVDARSDRRRRATISGWASIPLAASRVLAASRARPRGCGTARRARAPTQTTSGASTSSNAVEVALRDCLAHAHHRRSSL